jgi:hypothetical protein
MLEKIMPGDNRGQVQLAKTIGKGLMVFALIIVILNEFLTVDAVNNSSGPFSTDQLESIGQASIAIGVLGILVLAGAFAMRFMDF